ncbi:MAG: glycosyl hydrolase family 18 protein [Cyclobacteriaceae bacterium]|nr:glycosyl hydrolase family 18 protein [Cyclobacteriaceae bacterium]
MTYEDPESLAEKMKFIKENKLAGAMFWEMSEDNTRSLLNAVYNGLNPKPNTPKN